MGRPQGHRQRHGNRPGHIRRHRPAAVHQQCMEPVYGRRDMERDMAGEHRSLRGQRRPDSLDRRPQHGCKREVQQRSQKGCRKICRHRVRRLLLPRGRERIPLHLQAHQRRQRHHRLSDNRRAQRHLQRLRHRRSDQKRRRLIHCPSQGRPSDCLRHRRRR